MLDFGGVGQCRGVVIRETPWFGVGDLLIWDGYRLDQLPLTRNWLAGLPMRTVIDKERENARLAKVRFGFW